MKRGAVLATLLMLHSGAGACSIAAPSPAYTSAYNELEAFTGADQSACASSSKVNCTAYNLTAERVAALRHIINLESFGDIAKPESPTFDGDVWRQTDSVRYGRTTQIEKLDGGSVARTTDVVTAYERLFDHLSQAQKSRPKWLWLNCAWAGLNDSQYEITRCQWHNTNYGERVYALDVVSAQDKSLPAGHYLWQSGGSCGGFWLLGPLTKS